MIEFLNKYGALAAFVVVMLEYACFPIPSEIVLPWVGSMIVICGYSFLNIWFISVLAGICGCLICYLIGYFLGNKINKKWSNKEWYIKTLDYFNRKHNFSLCFGRLIPIYRTYISIISGIKKHNVVKFVLYSSLGICIWNACLIYLGYIFYDNIGIVSSFYSKYKSYCLILILLIIIILIFKKIKKRKSLHKLK